MRKHAYLIMAHNNFYVLEKLLLLLDDERNDIYIHIDKKVRTFDKNKFVTLVHHSRIYFVPRLSVNWGGYSQIECELNLLENASGNDRYEYYHLISGADLPIKNKKYIFDFFDNNSGYEFIQMADGDLKEKEKMLSRIKYYAPIQEFKMKYSSRLYKKMHSALALFIMYIQKILRINRLAKCEKVVAYGSQWFSITHELVLHILSNKDCIKKMFGCSMAPDEIFMQTIAINSPFKDKIYQYNVCDLDMGNCREIQWDGEANNHPHVWNIQDFDYLLNSDKLFARKFDEKIDREIVDKIYNAVR